MIGCDHQPAVSETIDTFYQEKAAWEAQELTDYFLALKHTEGSASYYTSAQIVENIPEYVETGGVFVSVLPEDFPFRPVAETVAEIYEIINDAVSGDMPVDIKFDTQRHIPEFVGIKDTYAKKEYSIAVVDFKSTEINEEPFNMKEDFDQERLRQEKAAWEAQGIKAYRFTAKVLLDIATRPFTFTVGEEIDAAEDETSSELDLLFGTTISDIYSRIEDAVKESKRSYTADGYTLKSNVRYNEEYHYPEFIWWGPYCNGEALDGGGMGVEISAFEIL
jgi:hypothetical protein